MVYINIVLRESEKEGWERERERELRSFSEKFFVGGSMGSQIVVLLLQLRQRERESLGEDVE